MNNRNSIRTNYHTHTFRCHHAYGSDEEYVLEAIENGYKVLGFSDHSCWEYDSKFESRIRMNVKEFKEYKRSVLYLKEKYKDKITILLGLEAEYFPKYQEWLIEFCVDEEIDYLILGNHFYMSDEYGIYFGSTSKEYIVKYFDTCIAGLKTGMYAYLAHPELIFRNEYLTWTREIEDGFRRICQLCKQDDIPLEYNVLGMQSNMKYGREMYPNSRFWEIAGEYGCKAIIGMDAHSPFDLSQDLYDRAKAQLSRYNVELVTYIEPINYRYILDVEMLKESYNL